MSIPTWDTYYTGHQTQLAMVLETTYSHIEWTFNQRWIYLYYYLNSMYGDLWDYVTHYPGWLYYVFYQKQTETNTFYERLYYILDTIDKNYFTDLIDWSNLCHDYVMDWVQTRVAQINNLTIYWYENIQNINYYWYDRIFYYVNVFYDNLAYYSTYVAKNAKTLLIDNYSKVYTVCVLYVGHILSLAVDKFDALWDLATDLYPYVKTLRFDLWANLLILVQDIFNSLHALGVDLFPNLRKMAVDWFPSILDLCQNLYGQIRAFFANPNSYLAAALETFLYAWLDWWLAWLVDGRTRDRPTL